MKANKTKCVSVVSRYLRLRHGLIGQKIARLLEEFENPEPTPWKLELIARSQSLMAWWLPIEQATEILQERPYLWMYESSVIPRKHVCVALLLLEKLMADLHAPKQVVLSSSNSSLNWEQVYGEALNELRSDFFILTPENCQFRDVLLQYWEQLYLSICWYNVSLLAYWLLDAGVSRQPDHFDGGHWVPTDLYDGVNGTSNDCAVLDTLSYRQGNGGAIIAGRTWGILELICPNPLYTLLLEPRRLRR